MDTGAMKLRIVLHISATPDGLTASMKSPDQGESVIPASTVSRNGADVKMEFNLVGGVFIATLSSDLLSLDGTWSQGGASLPLHLKKTTEEAAIKAPARPQNPKKPYPYREVEVKYANKTAPGVTLAATLTVPQGKGPFPAVVLITGSGPQDRDESLMGHKPFLVLSDYLTRHGIAVLRADDRGTAQSTGNFAKATTVDFATDAEAGIAFLKTRPEVNTKKIGLIGHSEGGIIAPMIAARNHDVAFIVMMAGTGVPGDQVMAEQTRLIAKANGMPLDQAAAAGAQQMELLQIVKHESNEAELDKKIKEKLAGKVPDAQIDAAIKQLGSPWMRYFITYDPAASLRKVTCPVLVLNGGKDLQVPPMQSLPPIRAALKAAGNEHAEIDELPGLNHLFQTAKTGSPGEYAQIEETMSPVVLEKIAGWIGKQ
jgi:pimeloyl-ACP methyl ester carboxylesterase